MAEIERRRGKERSRKETRGERREEEAKERKNGSGRIGNMR